MIRRAINEDIPGIMKLLVQVDMVHHNGRPDIFKGPATKYDEEQLKEIIKDDTKPIFVYVDEKGSVLGHAFCIFMQTKEHRILTDIKTLYIDDICVDENARGQHVGTKLFEYVSEFAKENEFYNITLNVWECNPTALEFYKKMGLVPQKYGMEMILK
ncbi:MAG: GNAT family N-acetyltransferase [Lachnospiraceae bacterium]|nr:GNAT family N-acetyltransferase [Lachnospiraceae bacterium]